MEKYKQKLIEQSRLVLVANQAKELQRKANENAIKYLELTSPQ